MKTIKEVELEEKNRELQDRINSAINYIENAKMKDGRYDSRKLPVKPLLDILKR